MAKLQYRQLGSGEMATYSCVFDFSHILPFLQRWRKVEVIDYRAYEIQRELNKKITEMKALYVELDGVLDQVIHARNSVGPGNSRQDNPYYGDPYDAPMPKDSKKFRKKRAKPVNLWKVCRNAIINAVSYDEIPSVSLPSSDVTSTVINQIDQPVGKPGQENMSKAERRRQNQQHQQQS
jgi:hypothetical protein